MAFRGPMSLGSAGAPQGPWWGRGPSGHLQPTVPASLGSSRRAGLGHALMAVGSKPVLPTFGWCGSAPWTLKDTHPGLRTFP